ncbi:MAG: hypothetical protein ACK2UL_08795, partial [Anaerolineae bacterium]
MLETESTKRARAAVSEELARLKGYDWVNHALSALDGAVRGVMAGLSADEIRAILRGDGPTEKPNPRYRAQVKSFVLHIRPKYYQRASTWVTHTWRLGWLSVFLGVPGATDEDLLFRNLDGTGRLHAEAFPDVGTVSTRAQLK